MRKVLLVLSVTLLTITAYSQTPVDTADLRVKINDWIVPNSNRQITASKVNQLFNGIANLMKAYAVDSAYRINDTLFLTRKNGFQTIKVILAKDTSFANSNLVFNADRTHDGNHKSVHLDNFGHIELKANNVVGDLQSRMILDTLEGAYYDLPINLVRENVNTGTMGFIGLDTTIMLNLVQSGMYGGYIRQESRIDGDSPQYNLLLDSAGDNAVKGQFGISWDGGVYFNSSNNHNGRQAEIGIGSSQSFHELNTRIVNGFATDERFSLYRQMDSAFSFESGDKFAARKLDLQLIRVPTGNATDSVLTLSANSKVRRMRSSDLFVASNGITKTGSLFELGGALTKHTFITASDSTKNLIIEGHGNGLIVGPVLHVKNLASDVFASGSVAITAESTLSGTGLRALSNSGQGIFALSTSGLGARISTISGYAGAELAALDTVGVPLRIDQRYTNPTSGGKIYRAITITRSSYVPINHGMGSSIGWDGPTYANGGTPTGFGTYADILAYRPDMDGSDGNSVIEFKNLQDSLLKTVLKLNEGQIEFNQYGSGTNTGTAAYNLAVTSTGKIIESPTNTLLRGSITNDFPSVGSLSNTIVTFSVAGAALGDPVTVSKTSGSYSNGEVYDAFVSSANTVTIRLNNVSGGSFDIASATYNVVVIKY